MNNFEKKLSKVFKADILSENEEVLFDKMASEVVKMDYRKDRKNYKRKMLLLLLIIVMFSSVTVYSLVKLSPFGNDLENKVTRGTNIKEKYDKGKIQEINQKIKSKNMIVSLDGIIMGSDDVFIFMTFKSKKYDFRKKMLDISDSNIVSNNKTYRSFGEMNADEKLREKIKKWGNRGEFTYSWEAQTETKDEMSIVYNINNPIAKSEIFSINKRVKMTINEIKMFHIGNNNKEVIDGIETFDSGVFEFTPNDKLNSTNERKLTANVEEIKNIKVDDLKLEFEFLSGVNIWDRRPNIAQLPGTFDDVICDYSYLIDENNVKYRCSKDAEGVEVLKKKDGKPYAEGKYEVLSFPIKNAKSKKFKLFIKKNKYDPIKKYTLYNEDISKIKKYKIDYKDYLLKAHFIKTIDIVKDKKNIFGSVKLYEDKNKKGYINEKIAVVAVDKKSITFSNAVEFIKKEKLFKEKIVDNVIFDFNDGTAVCFIDDFSSTYGEYNKERLKIYNVLQESEKLF